MVQDFDRQRSELRMQIRKINAVLKEKNEVIEQLKGEKACLEKRIAIITVCFIGEYRFHLWEKYFMELDIKIVY